VIRLIYNFLGIRYRAKMKFSTRKRMEINVFGFLCALLMALILYSPSSVSAQVSPPRDRTLIVGMDGGRAIDPTMMNPFVPGSKRDQGLHELCMESLFYVNLETGEIIPWLAEGYEYNEDFTEITVNLREGVKWNDGKPFTADDVVFTYDMLFENPTLTHAANAKDLFESVEKLDDYTVVFKLKSPNPRAHLVSWAFPSVHIWGGVHIAPKHIFEKEDPLTFRNYPPVFTGPYQVISASETEFIWERRDDWWGTEVFGVRPAPEYVVFTWPGPEDKFIMTMAAGDLDMTGFLLSYEGHFTIVDRNLKVEAWLDFSPWFWLDPCPRVYDFNCKKYPWSLPEVRWAVSYAINRTEIIEIAWTARGEPVTTVAPDPWPAYKPFQRYMDSVKDLLEKYDTTEYDPDKTIAIFEDLGFTRGADGIWVTPNGTRLEMGILQRAEFIPEVWSTNVIVAQLRDVGIDAVAKVVEGGIFGRHLNTGDFDVASHWRCTSVLDPYNHFLNLHSKWVVPIGEWAANNHLRYSNPELDEIVDEWTLVPQGDPREMELFRRAMEIYLRDLPDFPYVQTPLVCNYDTTYWTNWPTGKNPYIHPCSWWATYLLVITGYPDPDTGEWIGGLKSTETEYATVYFTKDTPEFRGLDLQWYGPFGSGDAARIPADDAELHIRMGYASYTPPPPTIPTIPTEIIEGIARDVSAVKADVSSVKADVTSLSEKTGALAGQMGTLTAAAAIEGIAIIVLAVALIVVRRK